MVNRFIFIIIGCVVLFILNCSDLFAQWGVVPLPPTTEKGITRIKFYNNTIGIITTSTGNIYRSSDTGASWQFIQTGTNTWLNDIQLTEHGFYAAGEPGALLISRNMGNSWEQKIIPGVRNISCVYFFDSLNGIVAGWDTVLRTTNGGNSWSLSRVQYSIFSRLHFISRDTGYASGNYWSPSGPNSAVFRTTNAGLTWDTVKCVSGEELWDMCFIGTTGYAIGEHTMVFKTTDNGQTWFLPRPVVAPQPESFSSATFATKTIGWATGRSEGLYKTTDGGASWQLQMPYRVFPLLYPLKAIFAIDTQIVFTGGTISQQIGNVASVLLKTTNGGITFIDEPAETGAKTTISELYPNPAADEISFSVPAEAPGYYTYLVYSVLGELVHPLTSLNATEGKKTIKINTGQLAPGVYFLRVTSLSGKTTVQTKKFVVMR